MLVLCPSYSLNYSPAINLLRGILLSVVIHISSQNAVAFDFIDFGMFRVFCVYMMGTLYPMLAYPVVAGVTIVIQLIHNLNCNDIQHNANKQILKYTICNRHNSNHMDIVSSEKNKARTYLSRLDEILHHDIKQISLLSFFKDKHFVTANHCYKENNDLDNTRM